MIYMSELADGTKEWRRNAEPHREDGPAVMRPDGTVEWWINGVEITGQVEDWIKRRNILTGRNGPMTTRPYSRRGGLSSLGGE